MQQQCLQEAFFWAACAVGQSEPNPSVGAVLYHPVHKIIGRGFTQEAGGLHAERVAFAEASACYADNIIRESSLYVTLEPCSHHGKTPPCTQAILEQKVSQVTFVCKDPNPQVNGQDILQQNGVQIITPPKDIFAREIFWSLGAFLDGFASQTSSPKETPKQKSKPKARVFLKWAQSADGFLAPALARRQTISNSGSREIVFRLRALFKAVLVTPATVNIDRPLLTARVQKNMSLDLQNIKNADYLVLLLRLVEEKTFVDLKNKINSKWLYPQANSSFNRCQRYFMIPSFWSKEECLLYAELQQQQAAEFFFLFTKRELFEVCQKKGYNVYLLKDFADLSTVQEIVFANGSLQLLVEAGPHYAEKYWHSGHVSGLMLFRSPYLLNAKTDTVIQTQEKGVGTSISLVLDSFVQKQEIRTANGLYRLHEQMDVFPLNNLAFTDEEKQPEIEPKNKDIVKPDKFYVFTKE